MKHLIYIAPILAALAFSVSCNETVSIPQFDQTAQAPVGDIRALYVEVGHNMWCDYPTEQMLKGRTLEEAAALLPEDKRPDFTMRCDDGQYRKVVDYAVSKGVNMIVLDLGEALFYPSHPELAIEGTWSVEKMQNEIRRLNAMGVEVVPKLNFSTTHNGWMKDYRHMVSSEPYQRFCEDVIRDAYEIFGHPRFFHVGYDEETVWHQSQMAYQMRRTGEVWWADFLHILEHVHSLGARPMLWSDAGWDDPTFFERCPKYCVMQNWYYDECNGGFDLEKNNTDDHKRLAEYTALDAAGFDQIPCGTNWVGWARLRDGVGADDVIGQLVDYGRRNISKEHLFGFMMAPWYPCDTDENVARQISAIDLFEEAIAQGSE